MGQKHSGDSVITWSFAMLLSLYVLGLLVWVFVGHLYLYIYRMKLC